MTINFSYEGLNPEETAVFCDMTSYISTDILGVDKKKDYVELEINDGAEKIVEGKLEELKESISRPRAPQTAAAGPSKNSSKHIKLSPNKHS